MTRSDLRDARCAECGARCVPGLSHMEHNAGWKKKLLRWDWHEVVLDGYPGWDLVDAPRGEAKHPPFVRLSIRNKTDKSSLDISREFDDVAVGRFYSRDWTDSSRGWTDSGLPFVDDGEVYSAGWWFQKREDAYAFIRKYGGSAES